MTMNNAFILLCGSSSVGKTSLMQGMPEVFEGRRIETVRMDFTSIREQLGNPSWDDLAVMPDVLEKQQLAGMGIYEDRITTLCHNVADDTIYLLERSPLDITGYSHAFGANTRHMDEILSRANALLELCSTVGPVLLVNRPVDINYPYDRRNNTRPNEEIRIRCDAFLKRRCQHVLTKGYPWLTVITSVNEGQEEVASILKHVG